MAPSNRFLILLIIGLLSSQLGLCQQRTLAKFIITYASLNKVDVTESYTNSGGYIVFYTTDDGGLYMANVMSNRGTQSYGRLYVSGTKELGETEENYKVDIFNFRWHYLNDYNRSSGTASIRLEKVYKPQGIAFSCTMITESLDVNVYKGYMEGSLDFSNY